mmetsp:Transcript_7316/g.26582  ORF Transcript_7316/g.26582 Transcript_7316/m.26582 type:complete len:344 (-) Transcript_7316:1404-2435(-)
MNCDVSLLPGPTVRGHQALLLLILLCAIFLCRRHGAHDRVRWLRHSLDPRRVALVDCSETPQVRSSIFKSTSINTELLVNGRQRPPRLRREGRRPRRYHVGSIRGLRVSPLRVWVDWPPSPPLRSNMFMPTFINTMLLVDRRQRPPCMRRERRRPRQRHVGCIRGLRVVLLHVRVNWPPCPRLRSNMFRPTSINTILLVDRQRLNTFPNGEPQLASVFRDPRLGSSMFRPTSIDTLPLVDRRERPLRRRWGRWGNVGRICGLRARLLCGAVQLTVLPTQLLHLRPELLHDVRKLADPGLCPELVHGSHQLPDLSLCLHESVVQRQGAVTVAHSQRPRVLGLLL